MEILKFVEEANALECADALFDLYKNTAAQYGYDRILFSLMTDHFSLGLKAGHGVMQNYPDDWMKHYVKEGFQDCDPVRCFMFAKSGPFIWDELPLVMDLDKRQKNCLYGGTEAGLYNGAAVSLRGPNHEIAGVGAASSDKVKLDKNAPYILNLLSQHYYYAYQQILSKKMDLTDKIEITAKERDVLQWLIAGKSIPDIADILYISESAVKYRLSNIYRKFGTNNRYTVHVKALYNGLVNL